MKSKELECWDKELEKLSEQYDDYFTAVALDDVKKLISKLLTQQRTELLEEMLNLECLKEEEIDIHIFDGHNDILMCRNQLRNEIKKEIKKL